jgi:ABC-2 type transport system ATP-binding protein
VSSDLAVRVQDVSKTFRLPHEAHRSLKSLFVSGFRGSRTYEEQQVLEGISFEIRKGEFFGIVGRNGSGKSTLLKLLAGIYSPDRGAIHVEGRLTPFIELGVGFNQELTGRDNVYLNGALLGFTRKEMAAMYDGIVEFAGLERFMDQKLKNYSTGMQVRLAFSIAIRAETDVLLIDEVLAVGDENFQRKCYEYFSDVKRKGVTVVFVSHDMSAVRDFCTQAILVHDGQIAAEGNGGGVASRYSELNIEDLEQGSAEDPEDQDSVHRFGNGDARIETVWTGDGAPKNVFGPGEQIPVNIRFSTSKLLANPVVGMILQDEQDRVVFATNTIELGLATELLEAGETVTATFTIDNIYPNGKYSVSCAVANAERSTTFSRVERIHHFMVAGRITNNATAFPRHGFDLHRG